MKESRNTEGYRREYIKYGIGFLLALCLVYAAYFSVVSEKIAPSILAVLLLVIAGVQLIIQLRVFLHVGDKSEPDAAAFSTSTAVMLAMVLVVVVASLWVMYHLDYNMGMTPKQMEEFMLKQNSKGF